jgi:NADPH-dependent 7-cyano-7-deazaguanine reductase QueF-like protein
MEKILKDGSGVQLWLNPGFPTKQAILNANPKAKYLTFFKTGKIFCYTHNANKFWELSTLRPDWLVEDLSQIAHGKITNKLHFYQEVE